MPLVYLGLGSNIEPIENMPEAATQLMMRFPGITFSTVYKTSPREMTDQPDFFNAVAEIRTLETPEEIHHKLQEVENILGKNIARRFGPRTMDIDLLLYGDQVIEGPLTIPHPRMHERRFVLEPLCDLIDPEALHPILGESWKALLAKVQDQIVGKTGMVLGEEY